MNPILSPVPSRRRSCDTAVGMNRLKSFVTLLVAGLGAVGSDVSAQAIPRNTPFCLRNSCLAIRGTFGSAAVPANRLDPVDTTRFLFAYGEELSLNLAFTTSHTPVDPPPMPPPVSSPVNVGPRPIRPSMPLAIGTVAGFANPLIISVNNAVGGVRHFGGLAGLYRSDVNAELSDPVIACSASLCLGAAVTTLTGTALLTLGPAGASSNLNLNINVGAVAARPALVAVGANEFLLFRRTYFAGEPAPSSGIAVVRITISNDANMSITSTQVGTFATVLTNGLAGLAATVVGSTVVLAFAEGSNGGSVLVGALQLPLVLPLIAPQLIPIAIDQPDVPFLGLAQSANSTVLTVQVGNQLARVPLLVQANGALATRPLTLPSDLILRSVANPVIGHSLVTGPLPLALYDEGPTNVANFPKARGVYVGVCGADVECRLTSGATSLCGVCVASDCTNWRDCNGRVDAGVDVINDVPNRDVPNAVDVPNRDVPNGMDVPNGIDVPNGMDVPDRDVPMDQGGTIDDAGIGMMSADARAMTSEPPMGFAFGGGACACRTQSPANSPRHSGLPCAILTAVCVAVCLRKRSKIAAS